MGNQAFSYSSHAATSKCDIKGNVKFDWKKKSVTDFSHDSHFLELVNDAYKLKNYIEERRNQGRNKLQ